ncbi:MAG: hypothetical protein U0X75_05945 [Acidobacteriota bacterium]
MKSARRDFCATVLLSTGAFALSAQAQDKPRSSEEAATVGLRGRVVCLTEELQQRYTVEPDCDNRHHVYSLKTGDGKLYPFLPTDTAAAIWLDARYRTRELQVTARLFPAGNFIEVIGLQAWREGRLYNLAYHCDVCNISVHKPGPCECCQDPVEFRETPAEGATP